MQRLTVTTTGLAKGGEAIAREPSGRVVFVAGALPGEAVHVELTDERRDFARARVIEVLDASPRRVAPPCPHLAAGCGGCDLQHAAPALQLELKRRIVADALTRQAKLAEVPDIAVVALPTERYRTTVRGVIEGGRFGFRRRASHAALAVDHCLVAHELLDDLVRDGRYGDATEAVLRAGARTGERLVRTWPATSAIEVPGDVRADHHHELVAGVRFRISADSFFQCRPDGADALVEVVGAYAAGVDGPAVDLYAGVGLFAATVLADRDDVVAVEQSVSSTRDCAVNAPHARVVTGRVEAWRASRAALVVADPSRDGLRAAGVAQVVATGAERVVLVSCDPAAFGRDVALLAAQHYTLRGVTMVDLFGQTSHIEVVSCFDRR